MSLISITDITVLSNPAGFSDPYQFRITFECISPLEEDLEWKLIYVGSADSNRFDQELDTCSVGPVPVGVNSFIFEAAAPAPNDIPEEDVVGLTVILLTASYAGQEFVRIGYYVHTEYVDEDLKIADPQPKPPLIDKLVRNVAADKPRVTRFNIDWRFSSSAREQVSEHKAMAQTHS